MASIGRVYEPGPYLPQSCQKSKTIWTLPTLMSTQQTLMDLHQVNILTLIYSIYVRTVSSYLLLSALPNWFKLV